MINPYFYGLLGSLDSEREIISVFDAVIQAGSDEWEIAIARVNRCLLEGKRPDPDAQKIANYPSPAFLPGGLFGDRKPEITSASADAHIASAFRQIEVSQSLLSNWRGSFDERGHPLSVEQARRFNRYIFERFTLFDFFELPVFCVYRLSEQGTSTDFETRYPIEMRYYSTMLTVGGEAELIVGGRRTPLRQGTFLLIPPTCQCTIRRSSDSPYWEMYAARFLLNPESWDLTDWVQSYSHPYVIEVDDPLEFTRMTGDYGELSRVFAAEDLTEQHLARNLLENILLRVKTLTKETSATGDSRVTEAANYLLYHLAEPVSIEQVASHVGVSSSHLRRLFLDNVGVSPTVWLRQNRLRVAIELLQNTDLPVGEIAFRVGFDDALYFSRVFKREMKCSPRDYRNSERRSA